MRTRINSATGTKAAKHLLGCGAALAAIILPASAWAQQRAFDLPAESATKSIPEFARQAGIQIVAPGSKLRGIRTPALKGGLDVRAALATLIHGTGLRIMADDGATITLGIEQVSRARQSRPTAAMAYASSGETARGKGEVVATDPAYAQVDAATNPGPAGLTVNLQDSDTPSSQEKDIVVTGTLLRGIAPVGTNVIGVNREQIVASGAASTNDLLASIPQIGNFGSVPSGTGSFGLPIVRPNIRNLGASGGNTTLVLVNGHRMVGAGVLQTTVDPSIIPPDLIERVEVIPDGGSSIYGSDAIGGVVNIITRKRFNGISANAKYGFADNYQTVDASLTAGKDWGSGSFFAGYAYAWHDNILGKDRDYVTANNTPRGGTDFRTNTCSPGNVTSLTTGINYALPGLAPGTQNLCDTNAYTDIYPRETRNSVYAGLTQKLSDHLDYSATAYWSQRKTRTLTTQPGVSGVITIANPYFHSVAGEFAQNVALSFADVFGPSVVSDATFESWGFTNELRGDLGPSWQFRASANVGRSYNLVLDNTINTTAATNALGGTTLATALNPYNPAASNPAVLAAINNYQNYGKATQDLAEARLVFDGTLFALAGGDARLAIGGEYHFEDLASSINLAPRGDYTGMINSSTGRHVKSAFAELLVPLVGKDNGSPGLRGLEVSGSVRYDSYDDVGDTTNPKIAVNYKPIDDLTLRGDWGTSFHAPSLADTTSTADARAQILLFSPFRAANSSPLDLFRPTIVLAGGNPNIKPESATTWSAGFDWKPHTIPGLVASATYYNVHFTDSIGLVPFLLPTLYSNPNYSSYYILSPTLAQLTTAVGSTPLNGAPSLASLYVGTSPYVFIDARRNNLGAIHTDGIDFNLSYTRATHFGAVYASIAGTYTLDRDEQAVTGGSFTNALANGTGRLNFVADVGAKVGHFAGRAQLNYRDGYPILGVTNQTHVDSFKTVDLFFSYDLGAKGVLHDTMLTINVDNVFDQDPPYLNSSTGYTNGSTLGRLVSFGIRKKL